MRRHLSRRTRPLKAGFSRLFADDIFISYSRVDATVYALGLADELGKRGYACFLDQLGTPVGEEVPASLIEKLTSCTTAVLVATAGASTSAAVRLEIEAFKQTNRPIIPIYFDQTREPSALDAIIPGLPKAVDAHDALDTGVPSARVIARIEKSFTYTRRNQRMRLFLAVASTVLLVLIGLIAAATWTLRRQTARAADATKQVDELTRTARSAQDELTKQSALLQTARDETSKQTILAETLRRDADAQGRLASFRRAIAEAELERTQGADRFFVPVRKTLAAYDQYQSSEADALLRYGLDRLPRLVARLVHPARVTELILSPDRRYVSTLGADSKARLWAVSGAAPIATLEYDAKAKKVVLSPDGQHVVVAGSGGGGSNRVASLLALRGGAEVARLEHDAPVADACFNKTGEFLATFSTDYVVKVWRLSAGAAAGSIQGSPPKPVAIIQARKSATFDRIVLSPDGRRVAVVEDTIEENDDVPDSRAAFWEVSSATSVLETQGRPVMSERSQFFGYAYKATVWANAFGQFARPIVYRVENERVSAFAFGGDTLFAAASGQSVKLYELNNGQEFLRLDHQSPVTHVRFEPAVTGTSVLTLTADGMAHVWLSSERLSRRDRQEIFVEAMRIFDPWRVERISVSSDGRYFATSGVGNAVTVWEKTFNGSVAGFKFNAPVSRSTFSRDRQYLTIETADERYRWDTQRRRIVDQRPRRGTGGLPSAASMPVLGRSDGWEYSAIRVGTGLLQIEQTENGRILRTIQLGAEPEQVRFSARGRYIAVSARDKTTGIWETVSGRQILRPVPSVARPDFSADERYAVFQSGPDAVSLVELPRGRLVNRQRFQGLVQHVSVSHDARLLFVDAGRLWLWTPAVGDLRAIDIGLSSVAGGAFSPRGTRLLISDGDGALYVVDTAAGTLAGILRHETRSYGPPPPPARPADDGTIEVTARRASAYRAQLTSAAFTADDRYLATVATIEPFKEQQLRDATIFVWDLVRGSEFVRIDHEYAVRNAGFTPDSRHLVIVGEQRVDHLLWMTDDVAAEARRRLAQSSRR